MSRLPARPVTLVYAETRDFLRVLGAAQAFDIF